MSTIELINVFKNFTVKGNKILEVLKDINMQIGDEEIVALVGASGSGKSTIANLILRLLDVTKGDILYNGKNITKIKGRELKSYRSHVQMIFQDPYSSLDPTHTVRWHVERPLKIRNVTDIDNNVNNILEEVSLSPPEFYANMLPHQLSGGLRQRVYIARALATNPEILIADEPVSMLDASVKASILELLMSLNKKRKISILYITHDLSTVSYVSKKIYVIENGGIIESGNTRDILKSPQNEYTERLIMAAPDPYKRI